jgi:ABC-type antimicrobial peptide transport system permease subunit
MAFDSSLPVVPETLDERLGALMTERRLVMSVLSGFGTVSLLLAVIGVYALLSFAVALRAHEIGVRAALGAGRGEIVRLVVGNAARVVLPGAAIGLLLAFWLTRLLEVMLVGVTRTDPVSYVGAALLLTAVALTAALVPARRAARVDPLTTLRAR